jgi:hypothetical protein
MENFINRLKEGHWELTPGNNYLKFTSRLITANPSDITSAMGKLIGNLGIGFGKGKDVEIRHQANGSVSFRGNTMKGWKLLPRINDGLK